MQLHLILLIGAGVAMAAGPAHSQVRRQPAQADAAPLEIALQVGSSKYQFSGQGDCKAASQASIYGIAAALSSVSHRSGSESLGLTLWQPKSGSPAMMTLAVTLGSRRYDVDTVQGPGKRDTKGSGTATLEKAGAGAVFVIDAVAASGEKIRGKIRCGRFAGIHAEGG